MWESQIPALKSKIVLFRNGDWSIVIKEQVSEACAPPDPLEGQFFRAMQGKQFRGQVVGDEIIITPTE
jgi:hypothetical protein